ncbi:MAG: GlsB/YeaQ/YmgE family stress response membrane protein [Propionibacteriaceae bacterium]|nr:GlsB/YeaQ/YmgE family stress response membrane protein [Propionibacteriaceae bacterium]
MGIIAFLILGAIAGMVARALVPGRIGGGLIPAIVCGVLGAVVGGWLSSNFLHVSLGTFWDLRTWVISIAGSALVLVVWGMVTGRAK